MIVFGRYLIYQLRMLYNIGEAKSVFEFNSDNNEERTCKVKKDIRFYFFITQIPCNGYSKIIFYDLILLPIQVEMLPYFQSSLQRREQLLKTTIFQVLKDQSQIFQMIL